MLYSHYLKFWSPAGASYTTIPLNVHWHFSYSAFIRKRQSWEGVSWVQIWNNDERIKENCLLARYRTQKKGSNFQRLRSVHWHVRTGLTTSSNFGLVLGSGTSPPHSESDDTFGITSLTPTITFCIALIDSSFG